MTNPLRAIVLSLAVVTLTASAATPPNFPDVLAAQLERVAERPSDPQVHNDLGNLLTLDGRYGEAETAYLRALELDPGHVGARFNLALLLQQEGKKRLATEQYTELLERAPYHAWANYQLGVILEERGQRTQAIDRYARAFAFDNSLTFAHNNPHLIENGLVTEALLKAQRYRSQPGALVPREYGEADRLRELMLQIEEGQTVETGEEAEAPIEGDARTGDVETWEDEETRVEGGGLVRRRGERDSAAAGTVAAGSETGGRVLTVDDLETSSVGQVAGGGSAGRRRGAASRYRPGTQRSSPERGTAQIRRPVPPPRPQTNRPQASPSPRQSPAVVLQQSPNPGGTPRTQGGSTAGPQPSRRSTGQLDIELLPDDGPPPERLARLEGI